MTPPSLTAREHLSELRKSLAEAEAGLGGLAAQIVTLQHQIDAVGPVEAELRQLDAEESESYLLAAQSDDPSSALDAVKLDGKKRDALVKKLAIARAKATAAGRAIEVIQQHQRRGDQLRNHARAEIPVIEMYATLEEMVPSAVKAANEHHLLTETAFSTLNQLYSALMTLAHGRPEGGLHRRPLFERLETLSDTIKSVREFDPSEAATRSRPERPDRVCVSVRNRPAEHR